MTDNPDQKYPVTFSFQATLPPIQSAITFDGNGDGARIKLDLSRAECGAAVLLHQFGAGHLLKVTVEIVPEVELQI